MADINSQNTQTRFTSKQKIIIGSIVVVLFIIIVFGGSFMKKFTATPTLKVWGIGINNDDWSRVASRFNYNKKTISVEYTEKNPDTYLQELDTALKEGDAPDIFMINNLWIPSYKNIIVPLDLIDKNYNINNIRKEFVPVVEQDCVEGNNLFGLPISVDTLALYYNVNILDQLGIANIPSTWNDITNNISILRTVDQYNRIKRVAIPLGLADNINHAADILSALMLQQGLDIINKTTRTSDINNGIEALNFYTQFAKPSSLFYTWNSEFTNSLDSFAFGQSVFYIGYLRDAELIKEKNPNLIFDIAEFPQSSKQNNKTTFASYNVLVVSKQSTNPQIAWAFIKYLTTDDITDQITSQANLLPSKRSLIEYYINMPLMSAFAKGALVAKTFYCPDYTQYEYLFNDTITNVALKNMPVKDALDKLQTNLSYQLYK